MTPTAAVLDRPAVSTLATVAHELRALYGSHLTTILLKTGVTEQHPRHLIASGLRAYDAQDTELAIPWAALTGLATAGTQALDLTHWTVPIDTAEHYHQALGEAPYLMELTGQWLLKQGHPQGLVQALHALADEQTVGWNRLSLPAAEEPTAQPGSQTLLQKTEEQVQLELQTEFIGLDDARASELSARMVGLVLGQIMNCGQDIGALRTAYGQGTGRA